MCSRGIWKRQHTTPLDHPLPLIVEYYAVGTCISTPHCSFRLRIYFGLLMKDMTTSREGLVLGIVSFSLLFLLCCIHQSCANINPEPSMSAAHINTKNTPHSNPISHAYWKRGLALNTRRRSICSECYPEPSDAMSSQQMIIH